jgi:hypothetical protein
MAQTGLVYKKSWCNLVINASARDMDRLFLLQESLVHVSLNAYGPALSPPQLAHIWIGKKHCALMYILSMHDGRYNNEMPE